MVVKEVDQEVPKAVDGELSSLDLLKRAAKSLEKSLGGTPIEPEVLTAVVKAIGNCKDIPDNLIRGLALVVASNALNNIEHPSHRPFAILEALYAVDHAKTVEFFTSAIAKQIQSTSLRVAFDRRLHFVRTWLLMSLYKSTKKLSLDLIADTLLLVAEISLHLPEKSLSAKLFGMHKRLDLPKLIEKLDARIASDQANAWKVVCLTALLLRSMMSERKRRVDKNDQNGVASADPNRVLVAKLWLRGFTNAYFTAKAYPGDDVFQFAKGFQAFKLLPVGDFDDNFRSTLKKCFLRTPEIALPTLANLFTIEVAFPVEIINLVGELIPDVFSSTNDVSHEYAAQIVVQLLYFTDQTKRKKLLDAVFSKQSKVKSRNEYAVNAAQLFRKLYPGYAQQQTHHFKQFVTDVFDFLEEELKSTKIDSVSANHARLLAALNQHINAETDSALSKRYVDLAAALFKQPTNSFPLCCSYAAEALALCDVPTDAYPQTVIDAFKQHIPLLGNAATPADFVFFTTSLLFKLARDGRDKSKTESYLLQALNSDAYLKEKFLAGLSLEAVSKGSTFVRDLFASLNILDQAAISKLQKSPSIVRFLLLFLEWPAKVKFHPSFKIEEHVSALRPALFSWLLSHFADSLNSGEFGNLYIKQIDSTDPHNLFDTNQLLQKSHFVRKLPLILSQYVNNTQPNTTELATVVFNAIVLANNIVRNDETLLKELSDCLIKNANCNTVLFGDFFDQGHIERVYELEPLHVRQHAIGFLVALESENSKHRDYAWSKCIELCKQMQIDKLNEVTDKNAAVFFTPTGTLHNTAIIDEYSDAVLDKHNMKRENKAYKFKDQVAEIELRKELAEKNKREGKLTQRQQDAVKKELAKETEIRKELVPFFDAPKQLADLLPTVVRSDPNGALRNYQIFHSSVVPALKSELVGKLMLECIRAYRDTFFSESSDYLDGRVLTALLRSARSHLQQPDWSWEAFPDQLSKVMSSLQTLCMMNNLLDDQDAVDALEALQNEEDNEDAFNEGITLGKLAFVVPILERVYTDSKIDERLRREATNFLKATFALDFLTVEEREWVPIKRINELLLEVMCDENNVAYFDDVFELMKGILQKLNDENCASENVGKYIRQLITQLRNPNEIIREHVAQLLMFCKDIIASACVKSNDIPHLSIISIATKDVYRQTDNKLHELAEELGIELKSEMHDYIVDQLRYPYQFWQKATATTLCSLFRKNTIQSLDSLYNELLSIQPAVTDKVGRVITPERDQWDSRRGVATAFEFYIESDVYDVKLFESLIRFLVPDGIADLHDLVRQEMYKAASSLISRSGAENVEFVLPYLENLLTKLPDTAENDTLRNGLVCLLGTLARYLEPNSPRLRTIFARLIDALSVPARQVQESVATCLPPLAPLLKDHAMDELRRLFRSLPQGQKYAERTGYAYGVAGLTKGLGLNTLKEISFLSTILGLFESKEPTDREAACLLILTMCFVHGRAFDPYIKRLLQPLIKTFGDQDDRVRGASQNAGAQMMKSIRPQAAKVFLPEILSGLDSEAWRAKCASADFLGSLSNCAAEQLSECLPKVVPGLANLMTDSHHKVKNSGVNALKQIATVITNPEILAISSHLITALIEPAKETTRALTIIVNTRFIHVMDAPALALMMPILKRALNDRDSEGRKMASQVITNLFAISEEKDVEPYMGVLIPNLKHSLLDPAPEVRSAAAQAIGSIVRHNTTGVFSSYTTDLIPWLKERMMSKSSMVDRLGAAQGLAEVVAAFEAGTDIIMAQAIEFASDPTNDPAMRDGYIRLFTYLPSTMGERFVKYIEKVIPSILTALSDETEYLRNSALHTGQILISTYCSQAKRYLLPSLLEGVVNESWRIRHAAVTLIGDFLFNISGISSKMTSDTANEDDTFGLHVVDKTIVKYVGQKSRDRILISLYLARFDAGVQVRQAASHVWKLVVSNTPRTVKELLSELFELVVYCISTSTEDRRIMATECLAEIVRKMGDRIMEALMPEVEKALSTEKTVDHRRGAIEALAVMINSTPSSEVFEQFNEVIVRIFRMSLCDSDLRLRQSSGETFAAYHNKVGIGALQEIVDPFFEDYAKNESEEVLDGIVAILSVNRRGRVLTVPSLINRILKFKSKAYVLSRLVDVISETIERNFIQIFTALFDDQPKPLTDEYFGQCATLLKAIHSNYTVVGMFKFLALRAVDGDELGSRLMLEMIKQEVVRDETLALLVQNTMLLYTSEHPSTQTIGSKLMSSLISKCSQNETLEIPTHLLAFAVGVRDESKRMHGLSAPGGWKPFTDLLALCSRSGSMDQREIAVHAISDFLQLTDLNTALRPITPSIVAILLRLLADQCPTLLKLHSVRVISTLVEKVPESIRPFAPQLTNFMKRILQETEDEAIVSDTATLVDLTEQTLEEMTKLVPGRA